MKLRNISEWYCFIDLAAIREKINKNSQVCFVSKLMFSGGFYKYFLPNFSNEPEQFWQWHTTCCSVKYFPAKTGNLCNIFKTLVLKTLVDFCKHKHKSTQSFEIYYCHSGT